LNITFASSKVSVSEPSNKRTVLRFKQELFELLVREVKNYMEKWFRMEAKDQRVIRTLSSRYFMLLSVVQQRLLQVNRTCACCIEGIETDIFNFSF
jgi:hypothetical protein